MGSDSVLSLPDEILSNTCSYLGTTDLQSFRLTCRKLEEVGLQFLDTTIVMDLPESFRRLEKIPETLCIKKLKYFLPLLRADDFHYVNPENRKDGIFVQLQLPPGAEEITKEELNVKAREAFESYEETRDYFRRSNRQSDEERSSILERVMRHKTYEDVEINDSAPFSKHGPYRQFVERTWLLANHTLNPGYIYNDRPLRNVLSAAYKSKTELKRLKVHSCPLTSWRKIYHASVMEHLRELDVHLHAYDLEGWHVMADRPLPKADVVQKMTAALKLFSLIIKRGRNLVQLSISFVCTNYACWPENDFNWCVAPLERLKILHLGGWFGSASELVRVLELHTSTLRELRIESATLLDSTWDGFFLGMRELVESGKLDLTGLDFHGFLRWLGEHDELHRRVMDDWGGRTTVLGQDMSRYILRGGQNPWVNLEEQSKDERRKDWQRDQRGSQREWYCESRRHLPASVWPNPRSQPGAISALWS